MVPAWLLLAFGCVDGVTSALMVGTVLDGHDGDARPLAEGTLSIYDDEQTFIDSVEVDQEGYFEVEVPAGLTIYATIDGEELVTSSFKGTVGIDEEIFEVEEGALFAVNQTVHDEWLELWDGCPNIGEGGAIVGEIRLYIPGTDQDLPVITTGFAYVENEDGGRLEACYLDDDGVYDPDATETGEHGQFAIFGVQPEDRYLSVGYYDQGYTLFGPLYQVWVEESWVSPIMPGYVELPTR